MWQNISKSKYRAVKTTVDGIVFDSKKEARYYCELKLLQHAGEIKEIMRQVPFQITLNDVTICKYIADFVIRHPDDRLEIIDVKGMRTPIYKLKKKLVEAQYCIKISER